MTGYLAEMRDTRKISGKAKKHKKIATSIKDKVEELENKFVKTNEKVKELKRKYESIRATATEIKRC
jgi:uncharacterized coiled-coil DUF342 family protein